MKELFECYKVPAAAFLYK